MNAKQVIVAPGMPWDGRLVTPDCDNLDSLTLPSDGIETGFFQSAGIWLSTVLERLHLVELDEYYIATPDALFLVAVPGDLTLSMALRHMFETVAGPEPEEGKPALTAYLDRINDPDTLATLAVGGERGPGWVVCDCKTHDELHWHYSFWTDGYLFRLANDSPDDDSASGALSLFFDCYAKAVRDVAIAGKDGAA